MLTKINRFYRFLKPTISISNSALSFSSGKKLVNVVENESKKTANVIMQRLPVNSLNLELLQDLTAAIKDLEEKEYKGIILSSSSPTVFSAGLDITEMYKPDEARLREFWVSLQTMWKTLYATPLMTIAAVNGHAPAGGCLLTMTCDHSIMVESRATIGLNETMLGIVAPKWFRALYVNTIGFGRAEHALKLGTLFTAEEALKLNIVDQLVESPADLLPKAEEQLDKWLKIPRAALQMTKISLRKAHVDELISYEQQEVEEIVRLILQDETQGVLGKYFESLKGKKK